MSDDFRIYSLPVSDEQRERVDALRERLTATHKQDWQPVPHPVPPELEPGYAHADPPAPIHWATIADKLDRATHDQLLAMAKGVV